MKKASGKGVIPRLTFVGGQVKEMKNVVSEKSEEKSNSMSCTRCNEHLDEEEKESPRKTDEGDIICDECYHKIYEIICIRCENYADVHDEKYILLQNPEGELRYCGGEKVEPGYYKEIKRPIYLGNIISGFECFWEDSIEKVLDLIGDESTEYEDGGEFICDMCNPIITKAILVSNSTTKEE